MSNRGLILIIDNDASEAEGMQQLLENDGYSVKITLESRDAQHFLDSAEPDLVLLNSVPDIVPDELLETLRTHKQERDVPVILVTTIDDAESRVKSLDSGDDLIIKPFDPREVLARVERQVTVSRLRVALRESEAEFRSVMESAVDAIISADAEGHIRSWNRAAQALFGFTEAEVLEQPMDLIIPERFRDSHAAGVQRVTSGGPSHVIGKTVELAAIRKDGSEFPIELSLATWFLDDERFYTGIIRDISERKQAEQKFRSVTESAIDAIISANSSGEIISWNRAATEILGHNEADALGQPLEMIIPERFHDGHHNGLHRVATTGESRVIGTTVELFARTKGGDELPIELSLSTWMVEGERYFTGIIRDIGERKRAEEALRKSEQALREKSSELEEQIQKQHRVLAELNEAHNQLILQEKMASLGKLSAGMAHELNNPAAAAQRGAEHLLTAFSRLQILQLKMRNLHFGEAEIRKLVDLDLVAQKRAVTPLALGALDRDDKEEALQDWLEARNIETTWSIVPPLVSLGYSDQDLEELSGVFSEEQFSRILDWLSRTYEIYTLIQEIGLGTDRITEIVGALKSYTFMDQAPIQAIDVREGLESTLVILRNKLKKGVTVRKEYAEDLPTIEAQGGTLNQVWTNLIDNAIDAMQGRGTLTIRAYAEDPWLVVEVEDSGEGILEENLSLVFDPFFTTKPPGEGMGLGLNISRNIVEKKHGGKIGVVSEPGKTCFKVCLPL